MGYESVTTITDRDALIADYATVKYQQTTYKRNDAMNTGVTIIESGASHDSEAIIAMLKDLLQIGIPIEQLERSDKLDLEFEHIQMHSTY